MTKRKVPNVVRGGKAIPLKGKTNYYYMQGRKHSSGGIDIGKNPSTGLEVEDGEVMHITDKEIKVFSSVPFLNGKSPAQKVMGGENPTKVFNQQESYKDKKGLNDDGTKKKQNGGKTSNRRKYTTALTDDEEKQFQSWYSEVAKYKNLNPNPDADGQDYDYRGYWKNEDRNGILGSNPDAHFTDRYKQPTHPTFSNESQYSNNEIPGGTWVKDKGTWLFKHNKYTARQAKRTADYLNGTGEGYILGTDTIIPNRRKKMGGLSRKKDYGSKSKSYPKVKTEDFAGGGRSYPIPTKDDAVDALRLAGLHGRSDVKAKVYNKYPELRKKSKAGGLYSVTVGGRTKLRMFPSTGESAARSAAVRAKKVTGGPKGINPDLVEEEDNYEYNYSLSPAVNEQLRQERAEAKQRGKNYNPYAVTTNTNVSTNTNSNNDNTDDFKLSKYTVKDYIRDNKENLILDGIGLTSNLAGSIIANRATNYAINKMVAPVKPTAPVNKRAAKLKTRININPQLAKMAESVASYERNVDNNTASSQVALSRKQRARANAILMANELYADKENKETSLINQDRLNQQSVANANVDSYNKYLDKVNDYENARVAFENQRIARKADNTISLINNINAGIQDVVGKTVKRKSENQTISAMALANPNLPIEVLYAQGLVNKRTYDAYKKAYRNKKKDKKD